MAGGVLNGWNAHVPLQAGLLRAFDYFKRLMISCVDEETRSETRR